MARALVTGGAGFLGSHLCDRLLQEGFQVVAMDNLITGSRENIDHLLNSPLFQFVQQDVTDYIDVHGALDYVFHLASPASPVDFPLRPIEIMMVNSAGTHRALGVARAKGARFFLASTSEVYGDPLVHPQTEEYWGNVNPIGVRSVYDESKRFAESLTMAYRRLYDLDTRIVRIFNTYGPRMRLNDGRVVPNLVGQALRGESITVYGDGSQTRSFCYCSDLIEGFLKLAFSDQAGPINIGNPEERTILDFARRVKELTGSESEIVFRPLLTPDDPRQRRPDITRARALLGWQPVVSFEDGMRRTIDYFATRM